MGGSPASTVTGYVEAVTTHNATGIVSTLPKRVVGARRGRQAGLPLAQVCNEKREVMRRRSTDNTDREMSEEMVKFLL